MQRRNLFFTTLLLVPTVYLLSLVGFPVVYNAVMSVQEVNLGDLSHFARPFVGLANYGEAIADPTFRKVALNTGVFVVVTVTSLARSGLACWRRCVFHAVSLAPAICAVCCWRPGFCQAWWLAPCGSGCSLRKYGVFNYVLMSLHLIGSPVNWLSDPAIAMSALNIAHVWYGMPFSMILIAAALTGIPDEHYEAASLDGAGPIARFRYITLPAITPALIAIGCLVTISALRVFDVIFALTQGGPVDATNVLPLLSYQASFQDFDFARGAAIGMFAFFAVFGVALAYVGTLRREAVT